MMFGDLIDKIEKTASYVWLNSIPLTITSCCTCGSVIITIMIPISGNTIA